MSTIGGIGKRAIKFLVSDSHFNGYFHFFSKNVSPVPHCLSALIRIQQIETQSQATLKMVKLKQYKCQKLMKQIDSSIINIISAAFLHPWGLQHDQIIFSASDGP